MDPTVLCPGPAPAAILAQPRLLYFGLFFCLQPARHPISQTGEMKMSSCPLWRRSGRDMEEK